jgi:hypothetical protein
MQPTSENLVIIGTLGLQAFFMDIHHHTYLKSILEDDSICSTFKACIHFYLGKGVGLWLIIRPSTYLFCIAHFTFTLTLHFYFSLI